MENIITKAGQFIYDMKSRQSSMLTEEKGGSLPCRQLRFPCDIAKPLRQAMVKPITSGIMLSGTIDRMIVRYLRIRDTVIQPHCPTAKIRMSNFVIQLVFPCDVLLTIRAAIFSEQSPRGLLDTIDRMIVVLRMRMFARSRQEKVVSQGFLYDIANHLAA